MNQEKEEPFENNFYVQYNKPSTSSMVRRNLKTNLSQISNGSTIVKKSGASGHLNRGDSKISLLINKSNLKRNSISIMNKTNHEKIERLIQTKNDLKNRI